MEGVESLKGTGAFIRRGTAYRIAYKVSFLDGGGESVKVRGAGERGNRCSFFIKYENPSQWRDEGESGDAFIRAFTETSSQVNTLPKAKSKTRSKQNKDMRKCSSVYSERGVPLPVLTSGGE